MISETSRYHGAFFVVLLEKLEGSISIQRLPDVGSGYYLLGDHVPIYLKHSTRRNGPWGFNFFRSHQETQQQLYEEYGECFTGLICGRDGIAGLSMNELRTVLDDNFEEQENITVRRRLKTMYQISGRDGALESRVSRQSIFDKVSLALKKDSVS